MSKNYNIDHAREDRLGFQEIVYGASKSVDQLKSIIKDYISKEKTVLCTKIQIEKAEILKIEFPQVYYDNISQILLVGSFPYVLEKEKVAILSGGTSDQYLVDEIYYTLKYFGFETKVRPSRFLE